MSYQEQEDKLVDAIDWLMQILKGDESISIDVDGVEKPSISKSILDNFSALQAMVQGRLAYPTKSAMDAAGYTTAELAVVWKDSVDENNGLFGWTGTAWEKSAYDAEINLNLKIADLESELYDSRNLLSTTPINQSLIFENLAIRASDGEEFSATGWGTTDYIASFEYTHIQRDAPVLTESETSVAVYSFFDGSKTYIGAYYNSRSDEKVKVLDVYPDAKYVRVSSPVGTTEGVFVWSFFDPTKIPALSELINDFYALTEIEAIDYFTVGNITNQYISTSGDQVYAANWRTTELIPVTEGNVFTFTYGGAGSVVPLASYDESGNYIAQLLTSSPRDEYEFTVGSGYSYVRACGPITEELSFSRREVRLTTDDTDDTDGTIYDDIIIPDYIYARQNQPVYLNAAGIVGDDTGVWGIPYSNSLVSKFTPISNTESVTLKYRNEIINIQVKAADSLVSPTVPQNFICLGDSLTDGNASSGIDGAYVNELSRLLTGVGTEILPNTQSPADGALTNIYFRGTRGDQPVKHEGRGGWRASSYLDLSASGSVTNAFWNPATSEFDINFYLSENSFTAADISGGVESNGSNLTVVILLGWNDVYSLTAESSAYNLERLIDKIKSQLSNVKIICVGLNPAPKLNSKLFSGVRYVSQTEVFNVAIRYYGKAYKAICDEKTNCKFLQISHVFDPSYAYPVAYVSTQSRGSELVEMATDYVHPAADGYAQIADAVYNYIAYEYCQ